MKHDEWKAEVKHLAGRLAALEKDMSSSTESSDDTDNQAESMDTGPDEGDPGTNDQFSAEDDDEAFSGHGDRHVESDPESSNSEDAATESKQAGGFDKADDKDSRKSMLLSILRKSSK